MFVPEQYRTMVQSLGLTPDNIFERPDIIPWRTLPDRENCTLDAKIDDQSVRFHVKRYQPARGFKTPAEAELAGVQALTIEKIPTAPLIAWGMLADRRSFIITQDLTGYTPADKLIEAGHPFDSLLTPTADLAARLHHSGLHHRDLYLCHFLVKPPADDAPLKLALIDTARVARLGWFFTRGRWIVKDIAQFWYSSTKLPISDEQRESWLKRYAEQRGLPSYLSLKNAVLRKAAWIARHDKSLNQKQPTRNVSIPDQRASA